MNSSVVENKELLQSLQMAYLSDICQMYFSESNIKQMLQKLFLVLPAEIGCLKMAVYIKDATGAPFVFSQVGFNEKEWPMLKDGVMENKTIKPICLEGKFGLLVPLLASEECMGVLFINTKNVYQAEPSIENFMRVVGGQIGQIISLNIIFNKMNYSEMRYQTLLENASCSIFVINLHGTILETNKQGEKLFGCSRKEMIGTRLKDYVPLEFKNQLAGWTQNLAEDKYLPHTEIEIKRKNGEIRIVDGSGVLVEIGNDKLVFLIGTDVTEINQLRAVSLLNDKLSTIGLLAAGVAHEINNPMACIMSNLEFMNETIKALKKEAQKDEKLVESLSEVVRESIQASERVKNIVNDLNSYSRKDDGEVESVDVEKILDSAIKMVFQEIKNRAVVERESADNLPCLHLNGGKLHQVFLNIIINAAQAIPEGEVKNNKIKISTKRKDDKVVISFQDTGKGISPEIMSRIFDPFFTTKAVGEGTGLGLFICHEIIKNMKGVMKVESTLGKGSLFTIELPLNIEKESY